MSDFRPSSILVDVELPDPPPVSPALANLFASLRVVLVGWYEVPEQTSPEQARDQFAVEAKDALAHVAAAFTEAGGDVRPRLVFTGDVLDTLARISTEEACDAVCLARPVEQLQRILVPLRGTHNLTSIAGFVGDLVRNDAADVTLLHVMEEGEDQADVQATVLAPARKRIMEQGVDAALFTDRFVTSDDPGEAVVEISDDYDLVVLGETEPSIREILFGTVPERIVQDAKTPVIVVRHHDEGDAAT